MNITVNIVIAKNTLSTVETPIKPEHEGIKIFMAGM
jgi:hypothetical protein